MRVVLSHWWEKLHTRLVDDHPHDPPTGKARKRLGQRYAALMDRSVLHIRVDYYDPAQVIEIVGTARELHGGQGVCTCCPRRPLTTVDGDLVGVTP